MTRKMMGVIYRAFKEGRLPEVDNEDISTAYDYVNKLDNYDFAKNHADAIVTNSLKEAVQAIFDGNYELANNKVKGFKTVDVYAM